MNDGEETTNGFTNPVTQEMNLIRYIGDEVSKSGQPVRRFNCRSDYELLDAPSTLFAEQLVQELRERGIIKTRPPMTGSRREIRFFEVNLTRKGWEQYEAEKSRQPDGNYGFLAMEFDNTNLDAFIGEVLKPALKEETGYELLHMRDAGKAGIIDNIMRAQIRDAKFVIADLTHDNNGAYWEAGYAEGLGKPVIYICEKKKFDEKKTHFDTNHCTTVPWSRDDDRGFRQELIATLRRSLGEVS